VVHAFATGDATKLTHWARSLALPSQEVTFFNFLASHDGIGINPARGILTDIEIDALVARTVEHGGLISYKHLPDGSKAPYEMNIAFFDALSNPSASEPPDMPVRRCLCAHAIQLALAGLPGIYFHSLFGSRGDRASADSSGIPRRINRQKFMRSELERELADPGSRRARVFAGMREMLRVRRGSPAFHPAGRQEILSADSRLFALRRTSPAGLEQMLCVQNVSGASVDASLSAAQLTKGTWRVVLGSPDGLAERNDHWKVTLGPYEAVWARA
jgi:sucrose phosphorylase